MKPCRWIGFVGMFFFLLSSSNAAPLPPLVIATDVYSPPFVMRGAHNQLYGFDMQTMNQLCKILNRTCVYHPMHFYEIFPTILNHQADIGIGAITITLARSKVVSFSIPYLLSYAQYFALNKWTKVPFSPQLLIGKKVGIQTGTIFKKAVEEATNSDVTIVEFNSFHSLIESLQDKTTDFVLIDSSAANYWQYQSDQSMMPVGKPFLYGYGFGIAVNQDNPQLLAQVNSALLDYQNNGGFQKAYNEYIEQF
ncbi:MAG: transporter substrate-binding domain-containing protein [Gammaproteobacteria bacterium]|nr:transporter substrate-binding domain-containing protein [Gammaproteobacteria bacterium]